MRRPYVNDEYRVLETVGQLPRFGRPSQPDMQSVERVSSFVSANSRSHETLTSGPDPEGSPPPHPDPSEKIKIKDRA